MKAMTIIITAIALLSGSLAALPGRAQTVVTLASQVSLSGIVVDADGNSFVADDGAVAEIPGSVPNATLKLLVGGIRAPFAIAVDGQGNVFVADNDRVEEVPAAGGYTTIRTLASGFDGLFGIAVDGHGNVFVADSGDNAVKVILAVDGSIPASPQIVPIGSGFNVPEGLAIDGNGNVFVADAHNNAVKEILAAGGYTTVNTLGSGFSNPQGVAVDGNGNVFVSDTGNAAVKEIPAAGGDATIRTLGSGLVYPTGIGLDGGGNVFVADAGNGVGSGAVKEIVAAGGYVAVETLTGFTAPVGIALDGSGNLFVSDVNIDSVTELLAGGGYAATRPVTAGLVGANGIAIDRNGNLFIADSSGAVKEMLTAGGYTQIFARGYGFYHPSGVAVDGDSNIFVADTFNSAVKEIVASGGYNTVTTLGSGFSEPSGVAVDGRGDVFVADAGNDAVKEVLAAGGSIPAAPQIVTLGAGFNSPYAVTVDGAGNVFVADYGNMAVKEIVAAGGYATVLPIAGTFNTPLGVALDATGDIFVATTLYIPPHPHMAPPAGGAFEILAAPPPLVAAVLPGARSVELGNAATLFATMINSGPAGFDFCSIGLPASAPAGLSLSYQTTDPATNMPTGTPNTPVAIPGNNGSQSFLLAFQGTAGDPFTTAALPLDFTCSQQSTNPDVVNVAAHVPGVDTVDLVMSSTPIADLIAEVATATNNGIAVVPEGGAAAFAVASANVGVTAPIIVSVDTGTATLPLTAAICQTDPSTAQCLGTPSASVSLTIAGGATPTFSVFLQSTGAIPFAPASSRVFVRFKDAAGGLHGATSVAVETG